MSDTKWRVTGPDGFDKQVALSEWSAQQHRPDAAAILLAIDNVARARLALQAGYRAEPIEPEPKMVTVAAKDLRVALQWCGNLVGDQIDRLRAALEDDK